MADQDTRVIPLPPAPPAPPELRVSMSNVDYAIIGFEKGYSAIHLTLRNSTGNFVYTETGNDVVVMSGQGKNEFDLGNGDDTFIGRGASGGQTVLGNKGNDVFIGGAGSDLFDGGDGDDLFIVSADDTAKGGAGYDTYVLDASAGSGLARLTDFSAGDKIRIVGDAAFAYKGNAYVIDENNILVVEGVPDHGYFVSGKEAVEALYTEKG